MTHNISIFIIFIGSTGLFRGALNTALNTMIGLYAPKERQGIAYGLAGSTTMLGQGFGATLGGGLASIFGISTVFGAAGLIYIIIAIYIALIIPKQSSPDKRNL